MRQSGVVGFVLGTLGILATVVGPTRARPSAVPNGRNGAVPVRASRVEPRVRRLVADQLGVDLEEVVPEVSLTDDLAADSLDIAELVVLVESEFGIDVSQRRVDDMRTFGDLVEAVVGSLDARARQAGALPPGLTARIKYDWGSLEGVEEMSPYGLQLIEDHAAHAPLGTRVEITLPAHAVPDDVVVIQDKLGRLSRRGIEVSVVRDATWVMG